MDYDPLYKYIPFQSPSLPDSDPLQEKRQSCFEKGEIWYPIANKLNDPFECNPDFDLPVSDEKKLEEIVASLEDYELKIIEAKTGITGKESILEVLKTPDAMNLKRYSSSGRIPLDFIHQSVFLGALSAIYSALLSSIGVLSLSGDPLNLSMWAHYGGNSSGICIEFQRDGSNTLGSSSTKQVNYVKERPKISLLERHKSTIEIITTKSHIWKHEKEWRDIKPEGDKAYPFPGKVQKIIFGLNSHEKTKELTKKIFGPDIEYEEVTLGSDYSLSTDCGFNHAASKVELEW